MTDEPAAPATPDPDAEALTIPAHVCPPTLGSDSVELLRASLSAAQGAFDFSREALDKTEEAIQRGRRIHAELDAIDAWNNAQAERVIEEATGETVSHPDIPRG